MTASTTGSASAPEPEPGPAPASGPGPGQVLFEFVRHWSRRSDGDEQATENGRLVLVTEAVDALTRRGLAASVSAIGREIWIDQSGASRLVGHACEAGYLELEAAGSDRRRRCARVTDFGHAQLERAHAWQERVFDHLADGWSPRRRQEFQRAMTDLVERSSTP